MKHSDKTEKKSNQLKPKKSLFKSGWFYIGIGTIFLAVILTFIFFFLGSGKFYENKKYNFSFKYPSDWSEEDLAQNGLDKYFVVKIKDSKTGATFQVKIDEQEKPTGFDAVALSRELDQKLPKELDNFKRISSKGTKVSGKDALEYTYSYSYKPENGEAKTTKQKMIILVVSNKSYYLISQASEDNFPKVEKNFNQIIKKFKV